MENTILNKEFSNYSILSILSSGKSIEDRITIHEGLIYHCFVDRSRTNMGVVQMARVT